jgi:hypothetical protein
MNAVTFTVSSREHNKEDWGVWGTYEDWTVAKEFADELVQFHKHYEAQVINSKGVDVYNTRRVGITPRPRKKR